MRRASFGWVFGIALSSLVVTRAAWAERPTTPLSEGLEALRVSDYERAVERLERVVGSSAPEAKLALARVALERGNFALAEHHARLAANAPSLAMKAASLRASCLLAQGKTKEAIALLSSHAGGKGADARRIRLQLGEALIGAGRRDEASDPLRELIEEYNDGAIAPTDAEGLALAGRAAFLLRSPKDANTLFKESERADKTRVETLLWEAELFLDKYDPGHAAEVTREALAIAPKRADARVMMARIRLEQALDFDGASKLLDEAVSICPRHPGALAVRASMALRDMDIASADRWIKEGLSEQPTHLELLSLAAASRFLEDDARGFAAKKREVFALNRDFSPFFGIVGELAEWEHRYDDIVGFMQEATKLDPEDAKAWAILGLTQMRAGDEAGGLASIRTAWKKDRFNVRVYNTLNLYEKTIPTQYEEKPGSMFSVRYPKDERAVLERYVPRLLRDAWSSMTTRYGFTPRVPVHVELYGSREHFSVRTSGLPNIGIQGVCFGSTLAAMSPGAEPFNWGNVVWHELGHVFAIQLSKNHVPRWFTEGLSEYETVARRPEWGRSLDLDLYRAISQRRLPGAVEMNRAFSRVKEPGDVSTAYYAASQRVIWTVERFGMRAVTEALQLWGKGLKTSDVIAKAFGLSAEAYDEAYRTWQLARLSRYEAQYVFLRPSMDLEAAEQAAKATPNDPLARVDAAWALLRAGKIAEAKRELDAALALEPSMADAQFLAAKIALGRKENALALAHLEAMRQANHDGYAVRLMLAELAERQGDKAAAVQHLEAARRLDPSQVEPLKRLFEFAQAGVLAAGVTSREAASLELLRAITKLDAHDQTSWTRLLEKLVAAKAWPEARRVGESVVFVDVMSGAAHVLYGKALRATGASAEAIFELETALLTGLEGKPRAEALGLLAQTLASEKRSTEAAKRRAEALAIDPENAEARAVRLP
jgi:tetratricopeptide (TPR) repeat protein